MISNRAAEAEILGLEGLEWLLGVAREAGSGLTWGSTPSDQELDPTLYSGIAGIVLALLEAHRHFDDDRFGVAAWRGARTIADAVDKWEHNSLYFGLAGMACALQAVHHLLGDQEADAAANRAIERVRSRFDGIRWSDQFELLGGNAGIALGALFCGEVELALLAVTPYLRTAQVTAGGVNWEGRSGMTSRFHHMSHGTLGIAVSLAAVGRATCRRDLLQLAVAGALDVVARNEADAAGFLVPHSDPQHKPDRVERYSYGWCHGPAGDAQAFRLLGAVFQDPDWLTLADRCWYSVTHSGLPERLRPGFWDNNGRCCGTAGVVALACDRLVEGKDGLDFGEVLVADLGERVTRGSLGARWSNVEFRATPSTLEPRTGWAMGNAGIIRELLRFARAGSGRDPDYAVTFPDQLAAHPCLSDR
ncbi:MAG: lanthionine synthetase LanC family protein [Candidatus Dormibacteria bacterium]